MEVLKKSCSYIYAHTTPPPPPSDSLPIVYLNLGSLVTFYKKFDSLTASPMKTHLLCVCLNMPLGFPVGSPCVVFALLMGQHN